MGIKVGDIVEYQGRQYRVLQCSRRSEKKFHLFRDFNSVWVYESDMNLVRDVASCEKVSNGLWVSTMDNRIGKTFEVKRCMNNSEYGPIVLIDGLWFRTYHLEKVSDFDIV